MYVSVSRLRVELDRSDELVAAFQGRARSVESHAGFIECMEPFLIPLDLRRLCEHWPRRGRNSRNGCRQQRQQPRVPECLAHAELLDSMPNNLAPIHSVSRVAHECCRDLR